jgi:hypothetical protein
VSLLAVAAAVVGAGLSLLRPRLLHGAAVLDGNLRGTALVVLAVGVPLVLTALVLAHRAAACAEVVWLGALMFLAYQGVMFCFGTPMNRLFPVYVAMLGLATWSAAALLASVDPQTLGLRLGPPGRLVTWLVGGSAALNALAWLARAVPIAWTGEQPDAVAQSGLDVSPVLVQDLTFWLPLALVAAVLAGRGSTWTWVALPAMLLFYATEGLAVASDQWWGVRADDSVPAVASMTAVPGGLALALVMSVAWWRWSRRVSEVPS